MRRTNTPTETLIGEVAPDIRISGAPIALVTLAAELPDLSLDELIVWLGDDVSIDPASGLRCVTVTTCRRVIDEHHARLAARAAAARENESRLIAARVEPAPYVADERLTEYADRGLATGGRS